MPDTEIAENPDLTIGQLVRLTGYSEELLKCKKFFQINMNTNRTLCEFFIINIDIVIIYMLLYMHTKELYFSIVHMIFWNVLRCPSGPGSFYFKEKNYYGGKNF